MMLTSKQIIEKMMKVSGYKEIRRQIPEKMAKTNLESGDPEKIAFKFLVESISGHLNFYEYLRK